MSDIKDWWITWAPYWKYIEDRHMSISLTEKILHQIAGPILIIGAGQGLIVKYLKDKGFTVHGIDFEKKMIKLAEKRHSIDIIHADAKSLPFKNKSYKTVIISSGVIDYITDKNLIKQIIDEALRVTASFGNLLIAFYQEDPVLEKIYKKIGVIDADKKFHRRRLLDVDEMSKKNPLKCVLPIMKWTNRSLLPTILYWTKLGLTLPKVLKEERKKMGLVFESAKKNNIDPKTLYDSAPEELPYREQDDVKKLLIDLGYFCNEVNRYDDCIIAKFYKSNFFNLNINRPIHSNVEKNWIIKTENLNKKYKGSKVDALYHLNISIKKGSIFGLLGPNGAGKTTTLSLLSGLIKPTDGKIYFSDKIKEKNIRKIIGYVPQDLALYPGLTSRENLIFFGKLYEVKGKKLEKKINELLSLVGLVDRANDLVKRYSTGMKRRLNLAIGLLNEPEIILMDEPTVGIDPQSRNYIFELVLELKKSGVTILYTTHYMEEANRLCDVIAIMDRGRIIIQGNPKKLVKKYGLCYINFKIGSKYSEDFILELMGLESISDINVDKNNLSITSANIESNMEIIEKANKISKNFNINLFLINIIEPSLESLFLDITGKNLRDHEEANL